MKITILDGYLVNPGDLSWSGFEKYGEFKCYDPEVLHLNS